jgi:hypothetical protein
VVVLLTAAAALAGCTTTQHEAQRERLDSARQRAALKPTRVGVSDPEVRAISIAAIRAADRTALVVTIRNRGRRAVTDLPISVGYTTTDGRTVYLNSADDLGYFQAHVPAIRPGGSLPWVYTTDRVIPVGDQLFARVGRRPSVSAQLTEMNVRIAARYRSDSGSASLRIRLVNQTSVPQYELQVYAYATRGSHYVAAGTASLDLGAGTAQSIRLDLVGRDTDHVHVQAVPTVLQ